VNYEASEQDISIAGQKGRSDKGATQELERHVYGRELDRR